MSPITIYYKDSKLDRFRTAKSLIRYYIKQRRVVRVVTDSSILER